MKPDYIFVGPHKSGTTWIDNYLRNRGDVQLPIEMKETFFFDKQYHKGWDWYSGLYGERKPEHRICVEVAPSLLDKPHAIKRVVRDLPDVTIIATLRNPIDRGIAHYFHYLKGGQPDRGFRWMSDNHEAIVSNGLYHRNLNWWAEHLKPEQIKILDYHDLNRSPIGYVEKICKTLNIPMEAPTDDVLYARINEDGNPSLPLLAKAARRGSQMLRMAGVNWLVNAVRQPAVRRLVYGPPPSDSKRDRIRKEAMEYYATFFEDFSQLDADFEFDTGAWRLPKQVSAKVKKGKKGKSSAATTPVSAANAPNSVSSPEKSRNVSKAGG